MTAMMIIIIILLLTLILLIINILLIPILRKAIEHPAGAYDSVVAMLQSWMVGGCSTDKYITLILLVLILLY